MRKRGLPLMGRPLRPAIRPGPGIGPPVVGMLTSVHAEAYFRHVESER